MENARRYWVFVFALCVLAGLGYRVPRSLNPGVYNFSERTDLAPFANVPFYFREDAVSSVAPQGVKIDLDLSAAKKVVYSSFELGNVQQKVHYVSVINKKDDIEAVYADLNRDGVVNAGDRVLLTISQKDQDGAVRRFSNDPLRILVDYRTASGVVIHKYLSVELAVLWDSRTGVAHTAHRVVSWFLGEGRFMDGKRELPVKLAIVDGDSDGIFNDFTNKEKDFLLADVDYDGRFEKSEKVDFSNLFDLKVGGRGKVQYRNYVFAWPYRLAVLPVSEWKDSAAYEPPTDGDPPLIGSSSGSKLN